jgi:predicted ATP-grasp superfamily ATP-dependent carboligase
LQVDLSDRKVLILDGELRSALAVTRSLGRANAKVIVGSVSARCLAGASKFAAVDVVYADPKTNEQKFISDIEVACRQHAITDLLPVSEVSLGALIRYRSRFSAVSLPYVDSATYDLAVDKYQLAQVAAKLGIKTPRTLLCDNRESISENLKGWGFPLVLKPVRSRVFANSTWLETKVEYAFSYQDMLDKIQRRDQYEHPFMIQEFIEGEGQGVFFLFNYGAELARFSHRRIREKPPSGGVSVLAESFEVDSVTFEQGAQLLRRLKWHGVAMVEFKVSRKGEPYLMEINPRFWGSLQLAIDADVDFPALLLAMNSQALTPVFEFKQGARSRWLLGDLDHLFIVLKSKEYSLSQKLRALLRFLNFFSLRTHYDTLQFNDARPFFYELKLYLCTLFNSSHS